MGELHFPSFCALMRERASAMRMDEWLAAEALDMVGENVFHWPTGHVDYLLLLSISTQLSS